MQSPSTWTTADNLRFPTNTSRLWMSEVYGKRKVTECDLEEESPCKIFLTEEKLIKNMQTLSLEYSAHVQILTPQADETPPETADVIPGETRFEFHQLLKDNLRKDNLQDLIISEFCNLERKKLAMQIVPYMPIHPAQLHPNNSKSDNKEPADEKTTTKNSSPIANSETRKDNDDHLFKKPFLLPLYTVEEPCENSTKRAPRMKRSYSQSLRSNNNLVVVELKTDPMDSSTEHSKSDYFIFEPSTPIVIESSPSRSHSSLGITEYFDYPSSDKDDDSGLFENTGMDVQSFILSNTTVEMDAEF